MTRKERERKLRRDTILEVAGKVFARESYFNATMSQIASEAEFGMGTIYQFFPNKQGLFTEVILTGADTFMDGLKEALKNQNTWQDRLKTFISYKLEWIEKQPELQRLIMELYYVPIPEITPRLIERFKSFRSENMAILKDILSNSDLKDDQINFELISLLITGTLNAIANDWLIGILKGIPTEYIPGIVGIVTGGKNA
jgi:AcrR family transcriptional regulator